MLQWLFGDMYYMLGGRDLEKRNMCEKMSMEEFTKKYSPRFRKVVQSCRNGDELRSAETYIRNALKANICFPDGLNANEYVNIFILSRKAELEEIFKGELPV